MKRRRRLSRNPLFIKSEFSLTAQGKYDIIPGKYLESQSFIHQVRILSAKKLFYASPVTGVAILYSSSQNSLVNAACGFHVHVDASQSFIHQVRILSPDKFRSGHLLWIATTRRNPLFIKSEFSRSVTDTKEEVWGILSQSFIHQVRILSIETVYHLDKDEWRSQSFIHQVRILSTMTTSGLERWCARTGSRNPLFIKSEFSQGKGEIAWEDEDTVSQSFIHQVRILSPPSRNPLMLLHLRRRNPLFIKSEFSQHRIGHIDALVMTVAILYSSSQNSLLDLSRRHLGE